MTDSYNRDRDWDGINNQDRPVPTYPGYEASGQPVQRPPVEPKKNKGPWIVLGVVIAILLVCGLGLAVVLASAGNKDTGASNEPAAAAPEKPKPTKLAAIGTAVKDGDFTFTVKSMKCDVDKVGKSILAKTAKGDYCILDLAVTNHGKEPGTFIPTVQKGFIGDIEYASDDSAMIALAGPNDTWIDNVNPGTTITVKLVYDVPSDKKLSKVEFHDSMLSGGVPVKLS